MIPGHPRQTVRLEAPGHQLSAGQPVAFGHHAFWVFPVAIRVARRDLASEIDIDLMKRAVGVVKFVHQGDLAHFDAQTGFLMHLSGQVVWQGLATLDPATLDGGSDDVCPGALSFSASQTLWDRQQDLLHPLAFLLPWTAERLRSDLFPRLQPEQAFVLTAQAKTKNG